MSKRAARYRKQVDEEEIIKHVQEQGIRCTLPKFKAATLKQKEALSAFQSNKPVVFLTGSAGTGKSLTSAYVAASRFNERKIDKIYLVRPAVSVGKSVGLLPGEMSQKLAPYFAQTISHLSSFLGDGNVKALQESGKIEMKAVEYLRGTSFEDCFVICEECQNFTAEEFEMMLTRIGKNCTMVFTADEKQHDLRGVSGLTTTLSKIQDTLDKRPVGMDDDDLDHIQDSIAIIRFSPSDVVRSDFTKAIVKMYYYD